MDQDFEIIVVFDTDCVLCSGLVRFLLRYEAGPHMRFASTRKARGLALARAHGLTPDDLELTYLVVQNGAPRVKSDAALALAALLRAPWRWLTVLRLVPRPVRDAVYDIIARNRFKWFGRKDNCFLPTPQERARFLDEMPQGQGQ